MARPLADLVHPSWASALAPVEPRIAELGDFLRGELAAGRELLVEVELPVPAVGCAVDVGLASGPASPLDREAFKSRMRAGHAGK